MPDPIYDGLTSALDALVPAMKAATDARVPVQVYRALGAAYEQLITAELAYDNELLLAPPPTLLDAARNRPPW